MSGEFKLPRVCLAESMGIRRWPAAVAWILVVLLVSVFATFGGQGGAVLSLLPVIVVGGLMIAFTFFANRWYFPRLESVIRDPDTTITDLLGRPVGSPSWLWTSTGGKMPRPSGAGPTWRGDGVAVTIWISLSLTNFYFDWQSGGWLTFGPERVPLAAPWNIAMWTATYIGWGYLTLAGISLLIHYAGRWKLLGSWVSLTQPDEMPRDTDQGAWRKWEGRWLVHSEGLKATSIIFFKGFIILILVSAALVWAWVFSLRQGGGFHPGLFVGISLIGGLIPLYMYGPSGRAWKKTKDVQAELRQRAASMISTSMRAGSEDTREFPSIVSSILSWANATHFTMSHGSPEAALIAIGSYMTQSVLAVGVAI